MTQSSVSSTVSPSAGSLIKLSLQVLIKPSESVFLAGAQVNSLVAGLQLTIWIIGTVIIGWFYRLLNPIHVPIANNSIHINVTLLQKFTLVSSFGMIILIPLIFFIDTAIIYGLAHRAGGVASFREQCASMLLFLTPLGIFNGIVAFIPFVGSLIAIACFIYGLVLQVKAVSAVHNLSQGQAIGIVLIPLAFLFVLSCVLSVAALSLLITVVK